MNKQQNDFMQQEDLEMLEEIRKEILKARIWSTVSITLSIITLMLKIVFR